MLNKKQWTSLNKEIFIELSKIYLSLTEEDIKRAKKEIKDVRSKIKHWYYGAVITGYLTNFGTDNCSLCAATRYCNKCFWVLKTGKHCGEDINKKTYTDIMYAEDAGELLLAWRARGEYMKTLY